VPLKALCHHIGNLVVLNLASKLPFTKKIILTDFFKSECLWFKGIYLVNIVVQGRLWLQ